MGRLLALVLILSSLLAGGALYYLQVYGYYREIAATGSGDVMLMQQVNQQPQDLAVKGFKAIDADSSPIRYRACFTTDVPMDVLTETYVAAPGHEPRNAPGWFDCFDAAALGAELEAGTARSFLGAKNIAYGVDRIVAVTDDGRGYVWHDLNECGEKSYDGTVVGEECPAIPVPATGN